MPSAKVFKLDPEFPDDKIIRTAALVIRNGGLVIFPTETVYGLGANYLDDFAIKRIYEIKKRPVSKKLTVHISDLGMIKHLGCSIPPSADRLIEKFWPGPLTVVLKSSGDESIGFRMPKHNVALKLIEGSGVPVVAPSANLSGKVPPTDAITAIRDLGDKVDVVLDAGQAELGVESTVVDFTFDDYKILREGAISKHEVAEICSRA